MVPGVYTLLCPAGKKRYTLLPVALSTSLFMFHLIFFSPHFIDHVTFLFPLVHSPSHSFHLPQSISFTFTLFGCIHITWLFKYIVSFTFRPIPSLEINDLRVSPDKFLILDRYSLLEAELRWFYYSLSLYIKQEIQHFLHVQLHNHQKRFKPFSVTILLQQGRCWIGKQHKQQEKTVYGACNLAK